MQTTFSLGPQTTPLSIIRLIIATCSLALGAQLLNPLFHFFNLSGPLEWLALSWWGWNQRFLWQPFSYLLTLDGSQGISFSLLINLTFQMYLLWILGSELVRRFGTPQFLLFYFGSGALTGLCTLMVMPLTGQYSILSTPAASVIATTIAWTMANPTAQIALFFLIPFSAKWLVTAFLGATLLIHFFRLEITAFAFYLFAALFGYLWSLIAWRLQSSFPAIAPFERWVGKRTCQLSRPFKKRKRAEIYDFKTGKPTSPEARFMDRMLEKISKEGKESLTWYERWKMRRISKRKK